LLNGFLVWARNDKREGEKIEMTRFRPDSIGTSRYALRASQDKTPGRQEIDLLPTTLYELRRTGRDQNGRIGMTEEYRFLLSSSLHWWAMLNFLRRIIPERSPSRLLYHKISAFLACVWYRFPSYHLRIIGVTGTSGKSSTTELIYSLLRHSGKKTGALSTLQIHIGDQTLPNTTLRTTMSPWKTQSFLRQMVKAKCEYAVVEVTSHAIDQNRVWGVAFDTVVLTNVSDGEHLDYHGTFADYVRTKQRLFRDLITSHRKPHVPKVSVLNQDDKQFEIFDDHVADKKFTYSVHKGSSFHPTNVRSTAKGTTFDLRVPNNQLTLSVPLIGEHNIANLLAAIAAVNAQGISFQAIENSLKKFTGIPGRLEPIDEGQDFSVVVDFSYKPSALEAVITSLKPLIKGRIYVIWGGAGGGRTDKYFTECGRVLDKLADEIILTTDDPYEDDPKEIAKSVRKGIQRAEGEHFFEIEDRYEAIRYAIFTAEKDDLILVAGRGHEQVQTIGKQKISFDDRDVCREILRFLHTPSAPPKD